MKKSRTDKWHCIKTKGWCKEKHFYGDDDDDTTVKLINTFRLQNNLYLTVLYLLLEQHHATKANVQSKILCNWSSITNLPLYSLTRITRKEDKTDN